MQGAEPRVERTDELLLYGWGLLVSAAGAASVLLSVQWPALTFWSLALLAGGFAASWRLRTSQINQNNVALVITGTLIVALLAGGHALEHLFRSNPRLSALGHEEVLALMILMLTIVRSYALYSRGDVAFSIVPGIAIFGLMAGVRAAPANMVAFVIFLFASLCLVSHEHYLSQVEQAGVRSAKGGRAQWMVIVSGLVLAVLALGFATTLATTRVRLRVPLVAPPRPPGGHREREWAGFASSSFLRPPGSIEIGTGPVKLGDRVLFTVQADKPHYWRMRTYERYNGHGWDTDKRYRVQAGFRGVFELPRPQEQALEHVNQTFTFMVPSSVLVGAGQPVTYNLGERSWPAVRYLSVDYSGGARLAGSLSLRPYTQYSVVSLAPPPVRVSRDGREPPMPDVGREFLGGTPLAAQIQARPLARRLTAGIPTVAGKALALQDYVAHHGKYSLDAPAVPRSEDVVAHFLRSPEPEAYCDVYASALTILCREAGVPARLAVGFTPGEIDSDLEAVAVKEKNRHAWTEVYIPGQGWTALEATPSSDGGTAATVALAKPRAHGNLPRLIGITLAALAALVLAWRFVPRRLVSVLLRSLGRQPQPEGARGLLIHLYSSVLRLLARHGLRRHASQTPIEYLAHLRGSAGHALGGWLDSLGQLTQDFVDARYSTRPVTEEKVQRARAILEQAHHELRRNRHLLRKVV